MNSRNRDYPNGALLARLDLSQWDLLIPMNQALIPLCADFYGTVEYCNALNILIKRGLELLASNQVVGSSIRGAQRRQAEHREAHLSGRAT